jgi:LacI family sucrose operon transcriptional repressor
VFLDDASCRRCSERRKVLATIKDVAKEAGVAVETVSRVLNNRGYISDKTRKKVNDAVEKLNYTPNVAARGLSRKDLECIAVIVPHVVHPYFAKMISRIEKQATKHDYRLFLYNSSGDEEKESRIVRICQNSFFTGVLLFSEDITAEMLSGFKIPIIIIERDSVGGAYSIQVDNRQGGEMVATHLIQKGCKNLLIIGTQSSVHMPGDLRDEGFMNVCTRAGVSCAIYHSTHEQYDRMRYYDIIETALSEHPECDGIFTTSDLIAAQVLQVCAQKGLKVPQDIKLVGFDDVSVSWLSTPRLTTVHQPVDEIAELAIDMIARISNGEKVPESTVLPLTLVEREST